MNLTAFTLLSIVLAGGIAAAEDAPRPDRPNVLWLIAEDFGAHLGCYGTREVSTPNLDRLAADGMRYTRFFTTAPVCSPSRSAFMTGMYQTTIGAHNHRSHRDDGYRLPAGARLITDRFRDAGYFTANVKELPAGLGFKGTGKTDWNFEYENSARGGRPFDSDRWDDLKGHRPFFAQINFEETHRAFKAPRRADPANVEIPPYYPDHPVTRADRAAYLDAATELDRKIGLLLRRLEADGLADRTIIVFFGDNGEAHVRGKQFCYDSGLRVPLIIRWPRAFPAPAGYQPGVADDRLIAAIDLAPTMLDAAAGANARGMQGQVFLGERAAPPRNYVFGARDRCDETVFRLRTVRDARYRYIRNFTPERPFLQPNEYKEKQYPVWNLLKELHAAGKLTPVQDRLCAASMPEEELYDLEADPHEVENLAGSPRHEEALKRLRAELERWIEESGDLGRDLEPADLAARKGVTRPGTNPNAGYTADGKPPAGKTDAKADSKAAAGADWFDRPMRWAQLTLVEDDPGKFDPRFWLDYFRRTHSDAACLSAGGVVAYYPTKVPFHRRSACLKDSDPFGELVRGCRRQGMVVIARTDSHAIHQEVFDAHPDWAAVDAEGRKRRHASSPDYWIACALGPYSFEHMTAVHREIVTLYGVDGIFTNRWAGSGMCYCEHCRRSFKAESGMDLPRTTDPRDPARRSYLLWQEKRLFELWRLWDSEIRKINPRARYIANAGGGALSSLDMKTIGELSDTLFADRQGRSGVMAPWANGKNAKEYRAALGQKPIAGIFSVGVEEPYRWKDSVQSEAELRIWVADGIANGLRPWFTKFAGMVYDRRWLGVVEDIYRWHHGAEKYLRNETALARVALVYSQQTAIFYGGDRARQKVEDATLGMYQALVEARVPFEMAHDRLLDPEHVDRFKLLILPNIAALSARQCEQLREYVQRGGSLLATFETSLYDEWGVKRPDFGLADLFGASFRGKVEGPMKNAYLHIEKDPSAGKHHPLLAGLEDAWRIIHGVFRLEVEPRAELVARPLTLIPAYPDLPMEQVFPRVARTDTPEVYLREVGRSRIVYFPWDIDRTFWEVLSPDHGRLLRNAVEWALNEDPQVSVAGPGVLDITAWRQKESLTVHLVNLTNPMMMKGPFRELIPIGEQTVKVRLPAGKKAKRVQLLVAGGEPEVEESEGRLTVRVPSVRAHEVVAIDF